MGQSLVVQYLSVFVSPKGRLSRELYWVYIVPVMLGIGVIWHYIRQNTDDEQLALSTGWLYVLLALYWMQACIMCRRMHDLGYPGSPAFMLAFVLSLYGMIEFYPSLLGDTEEMVVNSLKVLGYLFSACKWAFRLLGVGAMFAEGEHGTNQYGEPVGTLSAESRARKDKQRWEKMRVEFGDPRFNVEPKAEALVTQLRTARVQAGGSPASVRAPATRFEGHDGRHLPSATTPPRARRPGEFGRRAT